MPDAARAGLSQDVKSCIDDCHECRISCLEAAAH